MRNIFKHSMAALRPGNLGHCLKAKWKKQSFFAVKKKY